MKWIDCPPGLNCIIKIFAESESCKAIRLNLAQCSLCLDRQTDKQVHSRPQSESQCHGCVFTFEEHQKKRESRAKTSLSSGVRRKQATDASAINFEFRSLKRTGSNFINATFLFMCGQKPEINRSKRQINDVPRFHLI